MKKLTAFLVVSFFLLCGGGILFPMDVQAGPPIIDKIKVCTDEHTVRVNTCRDAKFKCLIPPGADKQLCAAELQRCLLEANMIFDQCMDTIWKE